MKSSHIQNSFADKNKWNSSLGNRVKKGLRCWIVSGFFLAIILVQGYSEIKEEEVSITGDRLTVMNYSEKPVYAAAFTIPLGRLYQSTGYPQGTPLCALGSKGRVISLFPFKEKGIENVRMYVSLQGGETLSLKIQKADQWGDIQKIITSKYDSSSQRGELSNGVVTFLYQDNRWSLSFATLAGCSIPNANDRTIINDCQADFWIDSERRGRLMGISAEQVEEMGLIPSRNAKIIHGEALVQLDGTTVLEIKKGFPGMASNVISVEKFTLLPGEPTLRYEVEFSAKEGEKRYLAFMEHGGGVKGRCGKLLKGKMMTKFDDPREPKHILLSGKENSFTRVGWRPERCWAGVYSELGNGVGFSTLKSINLSLPGTVIWIIGEAFFLRFLDADQENYPYEFSTDKPLSLGLAFIASCGETGIWNQTRQLFKNMTSQVPPASTTSCGVYWGDTPLKSGEVSRWEMEKSNAENRVVGTGRVERVALEVDFQREYRLKGEWKGESPEKPSKIRVYPLGEPDKKVDLFTSGRAGEFNLDFTGLTKWGGMRKSFVLEIEKSAEMALERILLEPKELEAPELGTPADRLEMTDIAAVFRWRQVKGVIDYEIELSRDKEFSAPTVLKARSEIDWPYYLPKDDELPALGKWFWRVRGIEEGNGGAWSSIREFTINSDITKKPVSFVISPERPLFTMEGAYVTDYKKFSKTIPDDIKPFVAINCEGSYADKKTKKRLDRIEYMKPLKDAGINVLARSHGPAPISEWMPLADLEQIFQTYPNVIGAIAGETLSAHYDGQDKRMYTSRLLKLCAKYGKYFYDADGSYPHENKYQTLYEKEGERMRDYSKHLIFAQKNNILHRQFVSQSSVLGLYLTDLIAQQGAWEDGGWYWEQVGFKRLGEILGQRGGDTSMPQNFWNLNFLMGISRGCAVFSFEGQTGSIPVGEGYKVSEKGLPPTRKLSSGYWTIQGELTPNFYRFCLPFMRGVIKHKLVPSKEEVLRNIKLAVYNDSISRKEDGDQYYYEWESLYRGTYGFKDVGVIPGTLMEFFPNTGRYHYFPVLPQGKADLGKGIQTLPLSQLMDVASVKDQFNKAYPEWYQGDALVTIVGDTLAILNSTENQDVTESYSIPFKNRGFLQNISGKIAPHTYVMGKFEEGNKRLWLQANTEYPERDTKLEIICQTKPAVKVMPEAASKLNSWDPSTHKLTLQLSHADGAVEVEITSEK